jgi:hypothetical protein
MLCAFAPLRETKKEKLSEPCDNLASLRLKIKL